MRARVKEVLGWFCASAFHSTTDEGVWHRWGQWVLKAGVRPEWVLPRWLRFTLGRLRTLSYLLVVNLELGPGWVGAWTQEGVMEWS